LGVHSVRLPNIGVLWTNPWPWHFPPYNQRSLWGYCPRKGLYDNWNCFLSRLPNTRKIFWPLPLWTGLHLFSCSVNFYNGLIGANCHSPLRNGSFDQTEAWVVGQVRSGIAPFKITFQEVIGICGTPDTCGISVNV